MRPESGRGRSVRVSPDSANGNDMSATAAATVDTRGNRERMRDGVRNIAHAARARILRKHKSATARSCVSPPSSSAQAALSSRPALGRFSGRLKRRSAVLDTDAAPERGTTSLPTLPKPPSSPHASAALNAPRARLLTPRPSSACSDGSAVSAARSARDMPAAHASSDAPYVRTGTLTSRPKTLAKLRSWPAVRASRSPPIEQWSHTADDAVAATAAAEMTGSARRGLLRASRRGHGGEVAGLQGVQKGGFLSSSSSSSEAGSPTARGAQHGFLSESSDENAAEMRSLSACGSAQSQQTRPVECGLTGARLLDFAARICQEEHNQRHRFDPKVSFHENNRNHYKQCKRGESFTEGRKYGFEIDASGKLSRSASALAGASSGTLPPQTEAGLRSVASTHSGSFNKPHIGAAPAPGSQHRACEEEAMGCTPNAEYSTQTSMERCSSLTEPLPSLDLQHSCVHQRAETPVGVGCSGAVFEANVRIGDKLVLVALKERKIFRDELELCTRLAHRNIVFCLGGGVGSAEGPFPQPRQQEDFIIFEHCAGSLARYLSWRYDSRDPQPLWYREVLDVGIGMLNALAWLHPDPGGAGTTHGDLSSCNVLVRRQRSNTMCVLLADFETARVVERKAPDAKTKELRLRRGTPAFMPPLADEAAVMADCSFCEDILYTVRPAVRQSTLMATHSRMHFVKLQHTALQRRDIYSVSMVMWHAMTGRIPFEGCRDHCEVNKQAALNRANPAVATLLPLPDGTPRPLQLFLRTLWDEDVHQANLYPCAHAAMSALKGFRQQASDQLLHSPVLPTCDAKSFKARCCQEVCGPPKRTASEFGEFPSPGQSGECSAFLRAAVPGPDDDDPCMMPPSIDSTFSMMCGK